jgi:hypothetical protein
VNILGDNIDTIKKITETLIDAIKEISLRVNTENTKYMLLFRHQNAGQNCDMKTANRSFENVAQFKYLGRSNKLNLIHDEIKSNWIWVMPATTQSRTFVFSSAV